MSSFYTASTVHTHVMSRMCVNAPQHGQRLGLECDWSGGGVP